MLLWLSELYFQAVGIQIVHPEGWAPLKTSAPVELC